MLNGKVRFPSWRLIPGRDGNPLVPILRSLEGRTCHHPKTGFFQDFQPPGNGPFPDGLHHFFLGLVFLVVLPAHIRSPLIQRRTSTGMFSTRKAQEAAGLEGGPPPRAVGTSST